MRCFHVWMNAERTTATPSTHLISLFEVIIAVSADHSSNGSVLQTHITTRERTIFQYANMTISNQFEWSYSECGSLIFKCTTPHYFFVLIELQVTRYETHKFKVKV